MLHPDIRYNFGNDFKKKSNLTAKKPLIRGLF